MSFLDPVGPTSVPAREVRAAGGWHRVSGLTGSELAECPPLVSVPAAPPWLAGIAVHKGEALALVDLDAALTGGLARAPERRTRMLVWRRGGFPMGFLVDGVEGADARVESVPLDLDALTRQLLASPAPGADVPQDTG